LTNLAQIEKYIEAQKVKNKSSNNSYDKNYIHQRESAINSLSMGTKAAQSLALQKWEETHQFLRNKDDFLASGDHSGNNVDAAANGGVGATANWSAKTSQHLMTDEKWSALNLKEKQLCTNLNLKPSSYLKLKQFIMMESAKNRAVKQAFLADLTKKSILPQANRP